LDQTATTVYSAGWAASPWIKMEIRRSGIRYPDMFPAIRYAGRLSSDPLNDLAQGEANMFSGTGAQTDTNGRWAIIV